MTADVEVFVDDTPGEVRGVVARDGRFERLLIQRGDDVPLHRLGARGVGRIMRVEPALRAAFVDLGGGGPAGFLPLKKGEAVREGEALEIEVTAEPRGAKGPSLRRLGSASGTPRLLRDGPDVLTRLSALAPGVVPTRGLVALQAGREAEEEAMADTQVFPEFGMNLAVQRTRGMIAVDIDHAPAAGRDGGRAGARANRVGLIQAARLIRLKGWGGLVVIDLVGTAADSGEVAAMAREAFDGDGASYGPLSRFGLLQLALPWTVRPVEERLLDGAGRRSPATRAIDGTRRLREALLSDTATPRWALRCDPETAAAAAPLVSRLGPRAAVRADPGLSVERWVVEEG